MTKKIAVLVRERQEEALRMAVGITLMDDVIDIYVLDRKIEKNEKNVLNLETACDMEMKVYTNKRENHDMEYLDNKEIAARLLGYSHILAY
ncbi:MAG: hypothetical protein EPN22_02890 [Nitrospirae bacterium]|nr:MAG: hypothetical protein EPN22_02890 [Nitrospirota bacterium]